MPKDQPEEAIQLSNQLPDPNVNFDGALAAAVRRKQEQEADIPRDDTGQPDEQAGTGSRRPLAQQILEEQAAEETPGPFRDEETGRFAPAPGPQLERFGASPTTEEVQPFVPDETLEETPEETPAETAERLLAGRFQTPEELETAYTELEQQQGRASGELGDLRGRVEELSRRLNQPPAPQPLVQPALNEEQIDQGISTQGVQFIAELYEADHPSYDAALDRLFDVAPRIAGDWQSSVAAFEMKQELLGELAPQIAAVQVPVTRNESQGRWNDTWRSMAAEHPEMNMLAEVMMQDLEANPYLTLPIKEGLPGSEKMVLENLLVRARDANRDKVAEAVTQQDEQVGNEKIDAQVVHASAGAARTGGESDALAADVERLKRGVLSANMGHNVHEEIARSRT